MRRKAPEVAQNAQNPVASFEGEDFSDNFCVLAGQNFSKMWVFRNSGKAPWPLTSCLKLQEDAASQQLTEAQVPRTIPLNRRVFPGEQVNVAVDFKAPMLPGKHKFNYVICSSDGGAKISPLVTVDINVQAKD